MTCRNCAQMYELGRSDERIAARKQTEDAVDIAVARERLREHKDTTALRAIERAAEALVQSNPRFTDAPFQPWLELLAALRTRSSS